MVIKDEIMAKVVEKENRQRCLDVRICPECGNVLGVRTEGSAWYLECCVSSCGFNKKEGERNGGIV